MDTRTRTIFMWSGVAILFFAGMVTLFLAFSGSNNDAAIDINAVYTNAASTIAVQQQTLQAGTMTPALSSPTVASTPFPSPTFLLQTPFLLATIKPADGAAATGCDVAVYVSDVTIPDGTTIPAGKSFTKTWKVINKGSCAWTATYQLVFVSGDSMGGKSTPIGIAVSPGGIVDVSVVLTSSSATGKITGTWRLSNDKGLTFGNELTVVINSGAAVTATSTLDPAEITPTDEPTATEIPTDTPVPTP